MILGRDKELIEKKIIKCWNISKKNKNKKTEKRLMYNNCYIAKIDSLNRNIYIVEYRHHLEIESKER